MPSKINLYNEDCLPAMQKMKDKQYGLAIVDPPYGIGEDGGSYRGRNGSNHRILPKKGWDVSSPDRLYFEQLKRVSFSQIIWGANHFCHELAGSAGWIFWNKLMGGDFSDGELAWTSFDRALRMFTFCNKYHGKIHPTEKPPQLYRWLLKNYAKPGDKILDTHGGSMSIAIACWDMGHDIDLYEIDKDYFEAGKKRLENHMRQQTLF